MVDTRKCHADGCAHGACSSVPRAPSVQEGHIHSPEMDRDRVSPNGEGLRGRHSQHALPGTTNSSRCTRSPGLHISCSLSGPYDINVGGDAFSTGCVPRTQAGLRRPSIVAVGSCDGFSTDTFERLHIDYAKQGYKASNRREYQSFLRWLEGKKPANPTPAAPRLSPPDDEEDSYSDEFSSDDDEDASGVDESPDGGGQSLHDQMDVDPGHSMRAAEVRVVVKLEEDEAPEERAIVSLLQCNIDSEICTDSERIE